jgi:prepilin-type N-terminal cleavage/methylation domain-containing protein
MTTQTKSRKAFTLLELLAVIAIIGILAGVILVKYDQVRENGWSTRCKGNLRTIYQAALNYSNDHSAYFPYAGPHEDHDPLANTWHEHKGWVNWTGTGDWPNGPNYPGRMTQPVWYGNNARTSIREGTIWEYINRDMGAYYCPKFRALAQGTYRSSDAQYDVVRSYAMNYRFGCVVTHTNYFIGDPVNLQWFGQEASRTLMFADMPLSLNYPGGTRPAVCSVAAASGNEGGDGVLDGSTPPAGSPPTQTYDSIGFIHHMAGEYRGHAVFLDGHIEAVGLKQPSGTWSNRTYDACSGQF